MSTSIFSRERGATMKRDPEAAEPGEERALLERRLREGMRIAETVARRMHHKLGGVIAADELLDIAQPALLDAVQSHDPAGAPFSAYLVMKLKWAMLEEARKLKRRRRVAARAAACAALERLSEAGETHEAEPPGAPASEAEDQARLSGYLAQRAAAMAVGLAGMPDADRHPGHEDSPEELLGREELRSALQRAVAGLPERHRALVERHYFAGESFDAIAADLGVSKSWASRLHAQAMESLARALRQMR